MAAAFSNDAAKLRMQRCSLEDSVTDLGNQGGFLKRTCDRVRETAFVTPERVFVLRRRLAEG